MNSETNTPYKSQSQSLEVNGIARSESWSRLSTCVGTELPNTEMGRQWTSSSVETDFAHRWIVDKDQAEEQTCMAIADCSCPVALIDPQNEDQMLLSVSARFEDLVGYRGHELVGHECRHLSESSPEDPAIHVAIRSACDTGESVTLERTYRRKSGELVRVLVHFASLVVGQDAAMGVPIWYMMCIHRDISDEDKVDLDDVASFEPDAEQIRAQVAGHVGTFWADHHINPTSLSNWEALPRPRWMPLGAKAEAVPTITEASTSPSARSGSRWIPLAIVAVGILAAGAARLRLAH